MLILFIGLFLITLLSGDAGTTKCPHRCCRDEAHAKKWRTKSQCIPLLFYSLSGNRRVNNFINHITWHDAPKFIVYRNTLNRTQGFTMDTRFCPLHLQQWMTVPRYFVFLFFFFWLFLFFFFFNSDHVAVSICPSACRPPDNWTVTFYFANAVEVCWFLFYEHDIKTINRRYASG